MSSSHISLCVALFVIWRSRPRDGPFFVSRKKVMQLSSIKSKTTYHKNIRDLQQLGLISYSPSYHPTHGSTIILRFDS
jgi:hypothetical protein